VCAVCRAKRFKPRCVGSAVSERSETVSRQPAEMDPTTNQDPPFFLRSPEGGEPRGVEGGWECRNAVVGTTRMLAGGRTVGSVCRKCERIGQRQRMCACYGVRSARINARQRCMLLCLVAGGRYWRENDAECVASSFPLLSLPAAMSISKMLIGRCAGSVGNHGANATI